MCYICDDKALVGRVARDQSRGMSIRDIAALHNLSIGTVQRHLAGHYRADRIPAPQAGTKGTTGQARAFDAPRTGAPPGVPASARAEPPTVDKLKQLLHKEPMSVFGLATAMACSTDEVELLLADSIRVGLNINPRNGLYYLDKTAPSGASPVASASHTRETRVPTPADVGPLLKKGPMTPEEIGDKLGVDGPRANTLVEQAREAGGSLHYRGGKWHLDMRPPVASLEGTIKQFVADKDGRFTFAVSTDEHLCSKYAREDCLNDFYDNVVHRGIDTVFNCGNMIDGLMPFNQHEITHHGLADQTRYLVGAYPQRAGVEIYSIWGADHEGWASRREGIDVGRYIEGAMREAGREDWHNLGFAEAFVEIVHPETGRGSKMLLTHPGGGSSYATSYFSQKLAESFGGGDKPAAVLIGHLHKLDYTYARNIHLIQCGTFQGQSLFMRSKKLAAHVGGVFCTITVDPRSGAFHECAPTFRTYYDTSYENARWSQHGPIRQPKFGVGGQ